MMAVCSGVGSSDTGGAGAVGESCGATAASFAAGVGAAAGGSTGLISMTVDFLGDGASASIDDVEVVVGSANDHRRDAPAEGTPHIVFTGKVVCGSVDIRGPRRSWSPPRLRRRT